MCSAEQKEAVHICWSEYIWINESIVIDLFLRLNMHEIETFRKQIVSMVKSETLSKQLCSVMVKPIYCARPGQYKKIT